MKPAAQSRFHGLDRDLQLTCLLGGREPFEVGQQDGGLVGLVQRQNGLGHHSLGVDLLDDLIRRRQSPWGGRLLLTSLATFAASAKVYKLAPGDGREPGSHSFAGARNPLQCGEPDLLDDVVAEAFVLHQAARECVYPGGMLEQDLRGERWLLGHGDSHPGSRRSLGETLQVDSPLCGKKGLTVPSGYLGFGLDFDQVVVADECSLDQGVGREDLTEALAVGAGYGFPVFDALDEEAGAYDVL